MAFQPRQEGPDEEGNWKCLGGETVGTGDWLFFEVVGREGGGVNAFRLLGLGDGAAIHCAGKHDRRNLVDDKLARNKQLFCTG